MRTKVAAFAVLGLAALSVASMQDGALLRLKLTEGDVHKYVVTMKGNQSVEVPTMGPMDMGYNMSYNQAIKIGKVDAEKGQADVEMITTDVKMEMTGPLAEMAAGQTPPTPKETKATAQLTNRYYLANQKMQNMDMAQILAMGSAQGLQPFIGLPEKAVKPGDTWDVVWPKNIMVGDKDTVMKATYNGDGAIEDFKGDSITLKGQVPMNVDMSKVMEEMAKANPGGAAGGGMAMPAMKMTGTIDVVMNAILEKGTGKLIVLTSVITTKSKMELVDMGMTMDSGGTINMKMALAK